jgi:DNA-directed RNA polymerase specialized sigma subunit
MDTKKEIIEAEIVEPNNNELTIQHPNVKKIIQEKKNNKVKTTIVTDTSILQQTNYKSGIKTQQNILTPKFNTLKERDEAIVELINDKYTQTEVANAMNLSQSRVSQIIRNKKK